jgi:hypothetical protein
MFCNGISNNVISKYFLQIIRWISCTIHFDADKRQVHVQADIKNK